MKTFMLVMFRTVLTLSAILYLRAEATAQEPVSIVIGQTDAPMKITKYVATYQKGGTYSRDGIHHAVEYQNVSDKEIVACQIGLVSFSIFNEFLDRTGGIDMSDTSPGKTGKGTWVSSSYADFSFHTGVAYVSKVRFADGVIWEADLDDVTAALRNVEKDFDASRLENSPDENK